MKLKMTDPRTGEPIEPLYVWRDGRVSWPVMGASPDDPSNTGGGGDGEPGGTGIGTGSGTGASGTGEPADGTSSADKPVSREEFDRITKHLAEADRKRDEAEKKLKEIDDAKKDELTKATERAEALEKSLAAKDAELLELRLDNAFLGVNDVTWHDKKVAMREAKAEGYLDEIIKDGKVDEKQLAKKLGELAKAKAYLVKEGSAKEEPLPPSGGSVGSGGKGKETGAPEDAALKSRYRVLNR